MKYLLPFLFLLNAYQSKVDAQRIITYSDKNFSYKLSVDAVPNNSFKENKDSIVTQISIARLSDNKIIQLLIPSKQSIWHWNKYNFHIEDMNFDENNDIRLLNIANGTNMQYLCWIYNSTNNLFEENKDLENIISPFFDSRNKKILSAWSNHVNQFGQANYKYEKDKLILYESREDSLNTKTKDSVIVSFKKIIDGKLTTSKFTYSVKEYNKLPDAVLSIQY